MKKFFVALLVVIALFLGARGYISDKGESYLQEILQAYNTLEGGKAKAGLVKFDNGFSGARALVELNISGASSLAGLPLKQPLQLREEIDYGPIFLSEMMPGLMRVRMHPRVSDWLIREAKKRFLRIVPGDINLSYTGILDWSHRYHERGLTSLIVGEDPESGERFRIEPVSVKSSFSTRTLQGQATIGSEAIELEAPKEGETLKALAPRFDLSIQHFSAKGPIFGSFAFGAKELEIRGSQGSRRYELRLAPELKVALEKRSESRADLSLGLRLRALDEKTAKAWEGIRSVELKLQLRSLGIDGLLALSHMQSERMRLQEELARAMGGRDDAAMQKAILALSALDEGWVEIYNKLFVRGQTRLIVDERVTAGKLSRLRLDLRFIGEPLQGNTMSAMIALAAQADRIVEGSFDLELEQALARRLYPEAVLILDSMVSKGMAKLEDGVYRLKGEIQGGKIVINGTRYAPQELLMLILM